MVADRIAEAENLRSLRCVSGRTRAECPICLTFYDEICYPTGCAKGAFECQHDLCYRCSHTLLVVAASGAGGADARRVYRCPLCRAGGCIDCTDGPPAPDWLRMQLASAEVVEAREATALQIEEEHLRLQGAARTAADQLRALMRLLGSNEGTEAGDSDSPYMRFLDVVHGALEVDVEVVMEAEDLREVLSWGGPPALSATEQRLEEEESLAREAIMLAAASQRRSQPPMSAEGEQGASAEEGERGVTAEAVDSGFEDVD